MKFNVDSQRQVIKFIVESFAEVFISENYQSGMEIVHKADETPVTRLDLQISDYVKALISRIDPLKNYHFISEEEKGALHFPSIILDPIDGTKELIKGVPECAVSLAVMESSSISHGEGWIYNPFNGLEIASDNLFCFPPNRSIPPKLLGFVSQTEWAANKFKNFEYEQKVALFPKGSIANKLGLLAVGACDFVVTMCPKKIWDIAAGTILCQRSNIYLYYKGKRITHFDSLYLEGPLLWCREDNLQLLSALFHL